MRFLVSELNRYCHEYYDLDKPTISDAEYDEKFDALLSLETKCGYAFADSPTQQVKGQILDGLKKVEHSKPMLSAAKTKEIKDIEKFVGNKKFYCSYKLDGLTLVIKYKNGKFVQAITRGNGTIGEDVTEAAKMIKNLPFIIPYTQPLELRGECVISWDNFRLLNEKLDGTYSHPRNLAAGSIRQLDTNVIKQRSLDFVAFECVTDIGIDSKWDCLKKLKSIGFTTVDACIGKVDDCSEGMQPEYYAWPVDGLIFEIDSKKESLSMGATGHHECCRIALKWADEMYETTLRNVEWNTTRNGYLAPVAVFDEIDLDGALTARATLHNVSIIKKLQLGIGDTIRVYRSNMVIPKIHDNLTKSDTLVLPDACPACGAQTVIQKDNDTEVLACTNPHCKGKLLGHLTHFVNKYCFDIDGLSEATLEKFIELGWLNKPSDVFSLFKYEDELIVMDGFGKKSALNLFGAIEKSKHIKFEKFIYSLGIPLIGRTASRDIAKYCTLNNMSFEDFAYGDFENQKIAGIGKTMEDSLYGWISDVDNYSEYKQLLHHITIEYPHFVTQQVSQENAIAGKTFCITGSLNHYKNRDELMAVIEGAGGKVSGSVSNKTNFLINNDTASTSGKNKKALELHIPIITEEEFTKMIGE